MEIVECTDATGPIETAAFPASGDASLGTRATGVLRIQVVPISIGGLLPDTSASALAVYQDYMERMYPVTGVELTVGSSLNAPTQVTADGTGWSETLDAVRDRRYQDSAPADLYYFGLLTPAATLQQYCRNSCVTGVGFLVESATGFDAMMRAAIGIGYTDQYSVETMAHEVGHNHGRYHAPCGVTDPDPGFPYPNAQLGWWGFDWDSTLYRANQYVDIMSYCDNQWISDYTYQGLLDRVAAVNAAARVVVPTEYLGFYRVLLVEPGDAKWGLPIPDEVAPAGTPELARVYDEYGVELDRVVVYRTPMVGLDAASVMVPEPEPDWYSIALDDTLPVVFQ